MLEPTPAGTNERPPAEDCVPLPSRRDAETYERLRAASDEQFRKTGDRPKIFLANLGQPQNFAAAAAFAANFFAAAGIEAVSNEGFETPQEAADAFRSSGCKIACICAPGAVSTQTLIDAARGYETQERHAFISRDASQERRKRLCGRRGSPNLFALAAMLWLFWKMRSR